MEAPQKPKITRFQKIFIITIIMASLLAGGLLGYFSCSSLISGRVDNLQSQLSAIQEQINRLQSVPGVTHQNLTYILEELDELQSQLSNIQGQISNLRVASNSADQNIERSLGSLQSQLSTMQQQISKLQATVGVTYQNITYLLWQNMSLSQLFEQVKESVVVVQGLRRQSGQVYTVQGSGFVYSSTRGMVVLTNYHVINGTTNLTVTFINGNRYAASVLGSNSSTDLAVLSTTAPPTEYKPLEIASSSTLRVGDPVIVVGTPYGLAGSMSEGIVSALNRTLSTDGYSITNVIQTTAPINPGNSGSPLMNYNGQVVGIITATVQESQGIGFAIPSDTILAEIRRILGG